MSKQKVVYILALLILGGVLFAASYFLSKPTGPDLSNFMAIGEIESLSGEVESRLPRQPRSDLVAGPRALYSQETLTVRTGGEVMLKFSSGAQVKLLGNSRVIAEADGQDATKVNFTLLSGDIQIPNEGEPGKLNIFREGVRVTKAELERPERTVVQVIQAAPSPVEVPITATQKDEGLPEDSVKSAPTTVGKPSNSASLSNDDINRSLRGQASFVKQCYLNFLSRNSKTPPNKLRGTVILSFTILPNGRAVNGKIQKSPFEEQLLHRCLTEVIERTTFKPFRADPIQILDYPITLE